MRSMAVLALLSLVALSGAEAAASPAAPPLLGVDSLAEGTIMESHQEALPHWVERGLSGAVLLHIDAGDGFRTVAPESLAALKDLVSRRDLAGLARAGRGGEGRLYDARNFVRVAAELGIVREVVWIAPLVLFPADDTGKLLKEHLGSAGFSAQESDSFRPVDGCYRGRVGSTAVSVCSQERLPVIQDPVLLSIDANFFPAAASAHGITFPSETRALFLGLRAARYAVLDAVFSYSVAAGEVPPDLRWIGDMVVQALRDPSAMLADNPPERWNALQMLCSLAMSGQQEQMGMLGLALSQLEKQPHDPAFLLYAAEASDRHGGGERSLAYAEEACRMDRGHCFGLREIGLRFLERGDAETARLFFTAGEKLLPGMEYGQLDLGIGLMKAGHAAEALQALETLRERHGAFPSAFLIGTIHLYQGDRAAARLSFDAALATVERFADVQLARQEIAQTIAAAAAFYREEGLERQAERLENDPRLRLPDPQAGPQAPVAEEPGGIYLKIGTPRPGEGE